MDTKVAIITGAGGAIGRAVSLALAQEGYALVLAGRRREPLDDVAIRVTEIGRRALVIPTDVTVPEAVDHLFARIHADFGRLDLLFNNAARSLRQVPVEEISYEKWRAVVDLNLNGAFLCIQGAFRMMKNQIPQGGRIINNGSLSAKTPRPNSLPYTATKHALTGLTKCIALDGRRFNIACGQINLGNIDTPFAAALKRGVPQANGSISIEPTIDTACVARAVVYMASLPLNANVLFMTVMPTAMPFVGRG